MFFLASRGYRCIAARPARPRPLEPALARQRPRHLRRRSRPSSSQTLDLKDAVHVGHSTGGGEVARYIGRHGTKRVAKAVLIGAIPPLMLKTPANPAGTPIEVFDQLRAGVARRPLAVLQGPEPAVLRLQPAGREGLRRRAQLVLAAGHDGRHAGLLLLHQGVLGDRHHRGPEEVRRADAVPARRRRPDRADRRLRHAGRPRSSRAPSSRSTRARRTACARRRRTR